MFFLFAVAHILCAMEGLAPSKSDADVTFRITLAMRIAWATADAREQRTLTRLAWFEGGLREAVATCGVVGNGSFGVFQVEPRSPTERETVCGDLDGQAELALARVRESRAACAHLPPRDQLSVYASGTCTNRGGLEASRLRWGPD